MPAERTAVDGFDVDGGGRPPEARVLEVELLEGVGGESFLEEGDEGVGDAGGVDFLEAEGVLQGSIVRGARIGGFAGGRVVAAAALLLAAAAGGGLVVVEGGSWCRSEFPPEGFPELFVVRAMKDREGGETGPVDGFLEDEDGKRDTL
jgi:hypothetical protein